MDFFSEALSYEKIWPQVQQYFLDHFFTLAIAAQLTVGSFAFLLTYKAAKALRSWLGRLMDQSGLSEASHDHDRRRYEIFLRLESLEMIAYLPGSLSSCEPLTPTMGWPMCGQ